MAKPCKTIETLFQSSFEGIIDGWQGPKYVFFSAKPRRFKSELPWANLKHLVWNHTWTLIPEMKIIKPYFLHKRHPPERCFIKRLFWKISQYSQEVSVLESIFNKVAGLKTCLLLQRSCFPVNIAKFLRTSTKNNCKQLLLT